MILQIRIDPVCKFCNNKDGELFYIMPVEEEVRDGKKFNFDKYELVCRKCSTKQILEIQYTVKEE